MDMMTSEVSRRSILGLFSLAAALPLVGCASVPRAAESAPAWRTKSVRSPTDGLNIVYHEAGRGKPLVTVERQSVVYGKRVEVRVDDGGRRTIKNKKINQL